MYAISEKSKNLCWKSSTLFWTFVSIGLILGAIHLSLENSKHAEAVEEKQAFQTFTTAQTALMGMDELRNGYNLFRGKGASPSVGHEVVSFATPLSSKVEWDDTVYLKPTQVEVTFSSRCYSQKASQESFSLFSEKQAESLAEESQYAMDASAKGSYGPVSGGLDASAAFGNKRSMQSAKVARSESFGRMSRSFTLATVYDAFVDWSDSTLQINSDLNESLKDLNGPQKSFKQTWWPFLKFFERFGTHVIQRGVYGAQCSLSTFFVQHASRSDIQGELERQQSTDWSVRAYGEVSGVVGSGSLDVRGSGSSSQKKTSGFHYISESKVKAMTSDVTCSGFVRENVCNQQFNSQMDNPVMISYGLVPIFELGLFFDKYPNAKKYLKDGFDLVNETVRSGYIKPEFWDTVALYSVRPSADVPKRDWQAMLKKNIVTLSGTPTNGSQPTPPPKTGCDSMPNVIRNNDYYHILNGYGLWHGGYLDTRGGGDQCHGYHRCVSTSTSENRDHGSGTWQIISTELEHGDPITNGSYVYLVNSKTHPFGGFLHTGGGNCAPNAFYCVGTSLSRTILGTYWQIVSTDSATCITEGMPVYLINFDGAFGGYLDTDSMGCQGNYYCVSTSSVRNRDGLSGSWKFLRA